MQSSSRAPIKTPYECNRVLGCLHREVCRCDPQPHFMSEPQGCDFHTLHGEEIMGRGELGQVEHAIVILEVALWPCTAKCTAGAAKFLYDARDVGSFACLEGARQAPKVGQTSHPRHGRSVRRERHAAVV